LFYFLISTFANATALNYKGYKFFFFSNENDEPAHIHVEKAGGSAKFWLDPIEEVYSYGFTAKQRKEIIKIIKDNSLTLISKWHEHFANDNPEIRV